MKNLNHILEQCVIELIHRQPGECKFTLTPEELWGSMFVDEPKAYQRE